MLVYIPLNIYWTLARNNQLVCKIMKANLFLVFFAACNFLIILAVDRSVSRCSWKIFESTYHSKYFILVKICRNLLSNEASDAPLQTISDCFSPDELDLLLGDWSLAGLGSWCWSKHKVWVWWSRIFPLWSQRTCSQGDNFIDKDT